MSIMIKLRKCTYGGCPKTIHHDTEDKNPPRCERHKYTFTPKKVYHDHQFHRARYFYGTTEWKKLRERYINQHPLCEHCDKRGLITPGEMVDHVIEIEDGGEKLDFNNLQTLCTHHHRIKTYEAKRKREEKKNLNGFHSMSDF